MASIKKWVAALSILALVFVAACSNGNNSGDHQGNTGESNGNVGNAGNGEANEAPAPEEEPEEPTKLTLYISDFGQKIPEDDDPGIRYVEEQTNTDLDIIYLPHGQYEEQLAMKFAAGEFPDFYQHWEEPNIDLIEAGLPLALNDLIGNYPNLSNIPDFSYDAVTVDGQILAIPEPPQVQTNRLLYVRKDWLDAVGLDAPKTDEEFLEMLRAFKTYDANGNGKADEIPYSARENMSWWDSISGMWGLGGHLARSGTPYEGEYIFHGMHPDFLKALDLMRTMYAEGLLDSEFLSNSRAVWEQKIGSGFVGAWTHAPELLQGWQETLTTNLPDQNPEIIPVATPRAVGYEGPLGAPIIQKNKTFIIFKDSPNADAVLRVLDFLHSEEGQIFTELGVEGVTYTKSGDTYEYDAAADTDTYNWRYAALKLHGFNETATTAKLTNPDLAEVVNEAFQLMNSEGTPSYTLKEAPDLHNWDTMYLEAAAKVILGQAELSAFEEFVSTWRAQGGDEVIQFLTEDYKSKYGQ